MTYGHNCIGWPFFRMSPSLLMIDTGKLNNFDMSSVLCCLDYRRSFIPSGPPLLPVSHVEPELRLHYVIITLYTLGFFPHIQHVRAFSKGHEISLLLIFPVLMYIIFHFSVYSRFFGFLALCSTYSTSFGYISLTGWM